MTAPALHVDLGDRRYPIHIGAGLLASAGTLIKPALARPFAVVVADAAIAGSHGATLRTALETAGVDCAMITVPAGEASKSFAQLEALIDRLLALGVERSDHVIALGGGVVGDLVGFACAILRRGCRFIQVPTTLLAQVDSSVGGKTAINTAYGKNLVGAFHQPSMVIADTAALESLPPRERRAGYAEIVKIALVCDAPFFDWLEQHGRAVIDNRPDAVAHAVTQACRLKAAIVAADERENGARALLNLGHTFGHALEAHYGYDGALLHGEAVAVGIRLAFDYAAANGLCAAADAERVAAHLRAAGLPHGFSDLPAPPPDAAHLATAMMQDKKVESGRLTLILASAIGAGVIQKNADLEAVRHFLAGAIARQTAPVN